MGSTTIDDIKENYRKLNMFGMKTGATVAFFFDKLVIDMKGEIFDPEFIPECIFDPAEFGKEENWKKTVREDEDEDAFGNKGMFDKKDDYCVCVLSQGDPDDEEYKQQMQDRLPMDHFMVFHITQ